MIKLYYPDVIVDAAYGDTSSYEPLGLNYHFFLKVNMLTKHIGQNPDQPIIAAFEGTHCHKYRSALGYTDSILDDSYHPDFVTPIERIGRMAYHHVPYPNILWTIEGLRVSTYDWLNLKEKLGV